MSKTDKFLTIVLTTKYTEVGQFAMVVDDLLEQVLPHTARVNIVCIDQNDDARAQNVCQPPILYVHSVATGLSAARNTAMLHVDTPWVLFLDDDAFVDTDTLATLLDHFDALDTGVSLHGTVYDTGFTKKYHRRASEHAELDLLHFDGVSSIGIVWSTAAIQDVGLFDERFGVAAEYGSSEESDLIIRLLSKGYVCNFFTKFKVSHPPEEKSVEKLQSYARGHGAMYRKHMTTSWRILLKLCYTMLARSVYGVYEYLRSRKRTQFVFLIAFFNGFRSYEDTTSK
jgi:GT2 family glycosyltransferase